MGLFNTKLSPETWNELHKNSAEDKEELEALDFDAVSYEKKLDEENENKKIDKMLTDRKNKEESQEYQERLKNMQENRDDDIERTYNRVA